MQQLTNLKAILHSKRANIYYSAYCRVMQKDGVCIPYSHLKKCFSLRDASRFRDSLCMATWKSFTFNLAE
ncbi:hypothetical protein [Acinetobacter rathckeae]|uniref:hypothetical protein n=1 Tax=Acinetobacter rathckeae TaxID=2605272 RepID=UPI0018A32741|nr:hypothetical protein [Acinetobacter rathckeae]MBF7688970.1 hypothetical protein [Acinetobacter rathckeae]MBF7696369.1 hypothetical protein [Acinetobacter rathckeae]